MKMLKHILVISLFFLGLEVIAAPDPASELPMDTPESQDAAVAEKGDENGHGEESAASESTEPVDASVKPGKLTVDKAILDFGTIEPDSKQTGQFVLTNEGEGPVEIIGKPGHSCGCTVPDLAKSKLEPGESTTMSVTYAAGKAPGKVSKKIWLDLKAPSTPRKLTMHIEAEIRKNIVAIPEKYEFEIRDTMANKIPIVLESADGQTAFKITGFACSGEAVKVFFDATKEASRQELPIEVNLSKLRGAPMGSITINTTHPKASTVVVPFKVLLPFTAEPPRKFFRDIVPGKTETATVTIISNYKESFELGEATCEKGLLEEISRRQIDGGYELQVSFTPPDDKMTRLAKDTLTVPVKDRPEDSISILFYGRTQ